MKLRRLVSLAGLFALVGCGATNSPLRVLGGFKLDAECSVKDADVAQYRGSLNVAGARLVSNATYLLNFKVESDLANNEVKQGSVVLADGSTNDIIVKEVQLSYQATGAGSIPAEAVKAHFVVAPASTSQLAINLIGPKGSEALLNAVGTGTAVDLTVTFRLRGETATGSTVESNEVSYPIRVYDTGATCAGATQPQATGPCGTVGGQDDSTLTCL